jgi:hypothetical protein
MSGELSCKMVVAATVIVEKLPSSVIRAVVAFGPVHRHEQKSPPWQKSVPSEAKGH